MPIVFSKKLIERLAECDKLYPLATRPYRNLEAIASDYCATSDEMQNAYMTLYGVDYMAIRAACIAKMEEAKHQYARNVLEKTKLDYVVANAGSVAIRCSDVTIHYPRRASFAQNDPTLLMASNGYGDGIFYVYLVTVKTFNEAFSRHESYDNEPPILAATLNAGFKIYANDCPDYDTRTVYESEYKSPVRVYSKDGKTYLVSEG
jgi:hypothetical protein